MRTAKALIIIIIALLLNYSLGWTYEKAREDRNIRNDSVKVAASHKYARMNPFKWFFMGSNYRKEWSAPVAMPVFHLKATKGGFKIKRLGGGEQTKALHLVNRDSSEWVLRSVDKNVAEALPESIQKTFIKSIVQDQISAAYPYAPLVVEELSIALGIPTYTSELYYIPDDPELGQFRPIFAHTVCFLSPKTAVAVRASETDDTDTLKVKLKRDNHNQLLQQDILTARLFDMLIADWDRHKDQWEWGSVDSLATRYYYPVPEDRDQAFFLTHGALPYIIRMFGMPHLIGFRKDAKRLVKLNHKIHNFDRYYMNELDRRDWEASISKLQTTLTDTVIGKAMLKLPPEIYEMSGKEIKERLKSRRDGLLENGLKYYEFLSEKVTITSSEASETYYVLKTTDSTVVTASRTEDGVKTYHRTFLPGDTKKISIVSLGKNDTIHTSGDADNIHLKLEYN